MNLIQRLAIMIGFGLLCGLGVAHAQKTEPAADMKRDQVFGPDKLWTIHLKIGAKEYQAMTPKGGGFPFGGFFPKKDEPKKEEPKKEEPTAKEREKADVHKSKGFGMEFPWVTADVEFEKKVVKEIGLRYTGNSTYQASAGSPKRPFKLDINHFNEEQKLFGMNGFNLRNGVHDSTRLREALAYSIFRAAKVPASRTAFAKVHLTVPDKFDNTYVGLYTLVEPVDKAFLREHFKSDKGMLFKPERIQGLPYLGEKWDAYKDKYNPKREATEMQQRRLIDFVKLVNAADDATFTKEIGNYLDVDNFVRFAAANSLISNLDSFFGLGHNYFMYLNPKTNKFAFIPWDLDLSFGGFMMMGGDQTEWAISQPYTGKNRLTERVLAIKENNTAYRGHLKALTENTFNAKAMAATITQMEATINDALAKEPVPPKGLAFFNPFGGKKQDLRNFVAKRSESVVAQLDGKSQGKVLTGGFGFGAKGPGKGGFGMGKGLAKPILDFSDTDKNGKVSLDEFKAAAGKLFKEAGGDEKTPVVEAELIDTINRLLPPPPGFGGFKPPPPPKGFGPGKGIAGAMMKQGGAGADKKLTRDEFLTGAEKLFQQWDKDKSGFLDEKKLADGLNQFIPPPEFGPPPFFGPDAKKDGPGKEPQKEKK